MANAAGKTTDYKLTLVCLRPGFINFKKHNSTQLAQAISTTHLPVTEQLSPLFVCAGHQISVIEQLIGYFQYCGMCAEILNEFGQKPGIIFIVALLLIDIITHQPLQQAPICVNSSAAL